MSPGNDSDPGLAVPDRDPGRVSAGDGASAADLAGQAARMIGGASTLPGLLAAAFDAFEVIRIIARASDKLAPGSFAAFMTTAEAAVQGRGAITGSPSLPPGPAAPITRRVVTVSSAGEARAALAVLAGLLASRLAEAGTVAPPPADRAACAEAAAAAGQIRQIMTGDSDGCLW